MRLALIAALLVSLAGCEPQQKSPKEIEVLCECFVEATYQAYKTNRTPKEPEHVCCKQCGKNGLPKGKVLSGDKLKVVPCPCPSTCECKSAAAAATCTTGTCKK